ncbi:hypothetical protein GIB67_017998 [Kingdonia uniflora]|uniref:Protein kinase domain-containing protein n=1 Tax=Kingdonia uniflora TaxID=39325 RepID=A0A7J7NX05_9MAGN|nr:hypothetical protein GIB67_017998 [Kingdonia uniflora]
MTGMLGDNSDLPRFSFEMLAIATNDFIILNQLGQGGFGSVYKGILPSPDGRVIAVKRLSVTSGQGFQEFKNEVIVISKLQHRNLLNPKISDFGMARIFGGNELQANTVRVVGTYYMSPEYAMQGKFSEMSDVFSFGVLLLEMVTGKKNTSFYDYEKSLSLLGYTWKLWKDERVEEIVHPDLSEPCFLTEILRCVQVGLLCVQDFSDDRPTMSSVISMLTSETATLPTPKKPVFSQTKISSDPDSSQNKLTASLSQGR